jgi:pyruvate dehydrogenase E1 component
VWSVTSFSELERDGVTAERARRLGQASEQPYVTRALSANDTPVIAVTDYVRAVAESIRAYVPASYVTLGTDGFGRSDTRANLRDFFEVDARWIAFSALCELDGGDGSGPRFAKKLGLDIGKSLPMGE